MSKTSLISILFFLSSATHAQQNSCKSTPLDVAINKVQTCLQMECPSEMTEQTNELTTKKLGIFDLLSGAIQNMKKVYDNDLLTRKPLNLTCNGTCSLDYTSRFRLHIAPELSIDSNKCDPQYFTKKPFQLIYNTSAPMKDGKEDSCKKIVETRGEDFVQNILRNKSNKIPDDDKTTYNGQVMSSAVFSKLLADKLCPGDCSLYTVQTSTYQKIDNNCTVHVDLDISCGKAKKSASWIVTAENVEAYQCIKP